MLEHIVFLDKNEGYILRGSLDEGHQKAIVYKTQDQGRTWSYIPSELPHFRGVFRNGK